MRGTVVRDQPAPSPVTLHGFRFSVYTWIARIALHNAGVRFEYDEVDPFSESGDVRHLHPFNRVPVLTHGSFRLFETAAIARYVDMVFGSGHASPSDAHTLARIEQVISIIDSYAYEPMVRQVFAHGFFRPRMGLIGDVENVRAGIRAAAGVLAVLEDFAAEGLVLTGKRLTLADFHLAPMVDYFLRVDAARDLFAGHGALTAWWNAVGSEPVVQATRPQFPD